jgi:hypothetical protein
MFSLTLRAGLLATLALAWLIPVTLRSQTNAPATTQVPAGSSAAVTPQKSTVSSGPATPDGQKIFKDAQSPQVRDKLQAAINSDGTSH